MARTVTSTEVMHRGRRFFVERITARREDGRTVATDVLRARGAVVILPVMDDGRYVLIRNYRAAVGRAIWELAAGTLEPSEEPAAAAARELEEETGYRAARLEGIARFLTTPGMTDELMHAFAAHGLTEVGQRLEADEEIEVAIRTRAEVRRMIDSGELADAKSLVAILLYERGGGAEGARTPGEGGRG